MLVASAYGYPASACLMYGCCLSINIRNNVCAPRYRFLLALEDYAFDTGEEITTAQLCDLAEHTQIHKHAYKQAH